MKSTGTYTADSILVASLKLLPPERDEVIFELVDSVRKDERIEFLDDDVSGIDVFDHFIRQIDWRLRYAANFFMI